MAHSIPSSTSTNLRPYALQNKELASIGRLVQATAMLEYIIYHYVCKIADLTEGQSIILLGRMSTGAKLKVAQACAVVKGPRFVEEHKMCFDNDGYRRIIACRNAAVHGHLLGKTDEGRLAFLVDTPISGEEINKVDQTVICYDKTAFAEAAASAEGVIPQLIDGLQLQPLLDKDKKQSLGPHPKAHRQQSNKKVRPEHPRQA